MSKPIRVLIVGDSEEDTGRLVDALQRGGFAPAFERVNAAAAMESPLPATCSTSTGLEE